MERSRTPPLSATAMEEMERQKQQRRGSKNKQHPHRRQQHRPNSKASNKNNTSSGSSNNNNNNTSSSDADDNFDSLEEELLYVSRHGKESRLLGLLMAAEEADEGDRLNVNCKGNQKNNRGWTPLHLASYFGQVSSVRHLLEFGARVNILNSYGESALHLASYTGREEVVGLLLQHDADTSIINSRGQRACDITKNTHIIAMLEAADKSATIRRESDFLEAASSGDTETLAKMLQQDRNAYISVIDPYGNTGLHLASVRGHGAAAVFLMQHGIDTNAKNNAGQTALDLAQTYKMKQVLAVQPIKSLTQQPQRFEGCLLKKSRFVGFKLMWVVLDRGVLSYFHNRGDASTGAKRRGMKYLDEAKVVTSKTHATQLRIEYSDGSKHTLHVEMSNSFNVTLQKWLNALQEHISYSSYYIHKGEGVTESDDDLVSLGSMKDSLQNAQAHRNILEKNVSTLKESISTMSKHIQKSGSVYSNGKTGGGGSTGSGGSGGSGTGPKGSPVVTLGDLKVVEGQASAILSASQDMCSVLSHCLALITQQEELREVQLQEERERCRLLQDSLHALATEHHELEKSISRRPSFVSMEEEFFDCDDDEVYGSPGGDVFTDAQSNDLVMSDSLRSISRQDSDRVSLESGHFGRTTLPVPMLSRNDFSIWSILKQCIGKELSKITMPVVFNEPLSFIQRLAEYMAYAPMLEKAANCDDPIERMTHVTAFAVSALSSNLDRIGKPFNPLLGETYELDRPDLGFRYIGEQVSHHPPITAFHAQGPTYSFYGSICPKLKFWGKSVDINPKGVITLELSKYNEVYTWSNINCCIHNIIVGTLWVEHYGTMEITCNKSNIRTVLNFKQSGWFGKDLHKIEGFIYRDKQKVVALYGSWVKCLYALNAEIYERQIAEMDNKSKKEKREDSKGSVISNIPELKGQKLVWQVHPKPPNSKMYYQFSNFSLSLNELVPGMDKILPPTDSRLRPDIRSMEDGNIDASASEKNRVEEKQRDKRKDRKKKSVDWTPTWFKMANHPVTKKEEWIFDNTYWDRQWKRCPDIF